MRCIARRRGSGWGVAPGLAGGLAAGLWAIASAAGGAAGQTDYQWVDDFDGEWRDSARWTPSGFPGQTSSADTATLGGTGAYTVTLDPFGVLVAGIDMANRDARLVIAPQASIELFGPLTGPGLIEVNTPGEFTFSILYPTGVDGVIDARVHMNGQADPVYASIANPTTTSLAGELATITQNAVISGWGQIVGRFNPIEGELSPGLPGEGGAIEFADVGLGDAPPVLAPNAVLEVDIGGVPASPFDRSTYDCFFHNDGLVLDGTLRVRTFGGYTPAFGDEFEIVGTRAFQPVTVVGSFASVELPPIADPNLVYRLRYEAQTVTLIVSCRPDLTLDFVVDSGDLSEFITAFLAQDLLADITGDGQVDSGDLAEFIGAFLTGC